MELALMAVAAAIVAAAVILARRPGGQAQVEEPGGQDPGGLGPRLDQAASEIAAIRGALEERRHLEDRLMSSVAGIERLVAGARGGRSGENLLAAALAEFPPDMVFRDFRVAGGVCEFALRLPDGRVLPIDSKWSAVEALSRLERASDPEEFEQLRKRVEKAVCGRLKEVAGYIDPSLTAPLAVVAVPDAVYACLRRAHSEARAARVAIVSYSLAVPFLLGFWALYESFARHLDDEALLLQIHEVGTCLSLLEEKIEGHLSRALRTADNAVGEMRSIVARAGASLSAVSRSASPDALPERENGAA